ncbi:MAG: hypothetical protein KatS3mg111_3967 [Pirellulaceae bacterium]|nr:MAG: hypothetical protein KatS3mg111_3967 [Pirellulaceae bacterium]
MYGGRIRLDIGPTIRARKRIEDAVVPVTADSRAVGGALGASGDWAPCSVGGLFDHLAKPTCRRELCRQI